MFETIAVLLYGSVAYVAAFVVVVLSNSPIGAAMVFASAGVAYLFQMLQVTNRVPVGVLDTLLFVAITLLPLAVLVSLLEFYHVL